MSLDAVLQMGRALVANVCDGDDFAVYRHSPSENVAGLLTSAPIIAAIKGKLERTTTRSWLDLEAFEVTTFEAKIDNTLLLVGDVFLRARDGAIFTYAQCEPTRPTIFIRNEFLVHVTRPTDAALPIGAETLAPGQWVPATTISNESQDTALVLTQTAGAYAFTTPAPNVIPVNVPMSLQPTSRARPGRSALPTAVPVERFVGYVPPCPGAYFRDNDRFAAQDGTGFSYIVEQVFSTPVGLVGTVMLLSKEGVSG